MGLYQVRAGVEAHQVVSGRVKDIDVLPFQPEAAYREGLGKGECRGVQLFEDDGMNGNWITVHKSDWIVKSVVDGIFTVCDDEFFQQTYREVT